MLKTELTLLTLRPGIKVFLFFIHTAKFDYFANQGKLHGLYAVATSDDYVISSTVTSWYEEYINWARKEKPGQYFDQSTTPCK